MTCFSSFSSFWLSLQPFHSSVYHCLFIFSLSFTVAPYPPTSTRTHTSCLIFFFSFVFSASCRNEDAFLELPRYKTRNMPHSGEVPNEPPFAKKSALLKVRSFPFTSWVQSLGRQSFSRIPHTKPIRMRCSCSPVVLLPKFIVQSTDAQRLSAKTAGARGSGAAAAP